MISRKLQTTMTMTPNKRKRITITMTMIQSVTATTSPNAKIMLLRSFDSPTKRQLDKTTLLLSAAPNARHKRPRFSLPPHSYRHWHFGFDYYHLMLSEADSGREQLPVADLYHWYYYCSPETDHRLQYLRIQSVWHVSSLRTSVCCRLRLNRSTNLLTIFRVPVAKC